MRRLLKFLLTIGVVGFTGSLACMLAMLLKAPSPDVVLLGYVIVRGAMETIADFHLHALARYHPEGS